MHSQLQVLHRENDKLRADSVDPLSKQGVNVNFVTFEKKHIYHHFKTFFLFHMKLDPTPIRWHKI